MAKGDQRGRTTARRRGVGRPPVDVQRIAKALAGPGIDTRFWVSAGTVGVFDGEEFVTTDKQAVYVDRLGPVVDVRLEPCGEFVTARWGGIGCGRFGFMLFPLRPGDEVVVLIPDGDLKSAAISIVAVLSNQTARVPSNWNNDRVLFDLNVPLDVRAPAVRIQSSNLQLNGRKVSSGTEGI